MLHFVCHTCGGNQIELEKYVKVNVVLDMETLKEGALLFDEDDSFYHSYHCAKCETVIKDNNGNVIHDPQDLEEYLKREFQCEECGSRKLMVGYCVTRYVEVTEGDETYPLNKAYGMAYYCDGCGRMVMEDVCAMMPDPDISEYPSHDEHYNGPKMSDEE